MSDSSKPKCRIVVDAMGGDFAPRNAVLGAIDAFNSNKGFELFLVGIKDEIKKVITDNNLTFNDENIIHTTQIIEMGDTPTQAIKSKPDSSIVVGAKLVKEKKADAFVSAGNTGAMMAASTLIIGRIPGIGRPTIGTFMPNESGVTTVFDVGASVDSKPTHLFEYAVMGSIFVKEIYGIDNPKVGLLSVGEEDTKGNDVTLTAFQLLKKSQLNFVGNIEGRDVLKGSVHVVVCDGFVGNILLKFGEGFLSILKHLLRDYASKGLFNKLKVLLVKSTLKQMLKKFDYQEYGGVPLLGVNGISIIGHGSSSPLAIKNMVLRAKEMYDRDLVNKIENSIKNYSSIL
ncbi:MAG: phosphate acyltransferase PlsX [Ignavibacteriaceae bacterium]|nr:phosphate acyltransferase PlsX [Ignavibacteriaceae bacterium]